MYAVSTYCDIPFSDVELPITLSGDPNSQNNSCSTGLIIIFNTPSGDPCTQINTCSTGAYERSILTLLGNSVIQNNSCNTNSVVIKMGPWFIEPINRQISWIIE
jgi:hypothetical protein